MWKVTKTALVGIFTALSLHIIKKYTSQVKSKFLPQETGKRKRKKKNKCKASKRCM